MKRSSKYILISLLALNISACDSMSTRDEISENYYISTSESTFGRSLYYRVERGTGVGRIDEGITAVTWNDSYILAEKKIFHRPVYYVIDIKKDHAFIESEEVVSGPYSKDEIKSIHPEFYKNGNIEFKKNYKQSE